MLSLHYARRLNAARVTVPHSWGFVHWLLFLGSERNIANVLASTQLAFVGLIALAIAWLGAPKTGAQRSYFLAVGLVFLFSRKKSLPTPTKTVILRFPM